MSQPTAPDRREHDSRILIVDDERANILILERVLSRAGYDAVRSTTDPSTVMHAVDGWKPDALLLDLMMPPPDGFAILALMAARPPADRIPTLVLTASAMPEVKERAFGLGASDFVTKPFDHAEVLLRLRNLLATRRLEIALRDQNDALERRVADRTIELTRTVAELRTAIDERQALMSRLVTAQEEERRRIANDIHDDTVQSMVAAALHIERVKRMTTDSSLAAEFDSLHGSVRAAVSRLRNLLFDVHPASLERAGLVASLRACVDRADGQGGPTFTLHAEVEAEPAAETRVTLYRIAQQAMANAAAHARATRIDVRVHADAEGVTLSVSDDGIGFDTAALAAPVDGHLGMTAMHERAAVAGGRLTIDSAPGAGTRVTVRVPHRDAGETRVGTNRIEAPVGAVMQGAR